MEGRWSCLSTVAWSLIEDRENKLEICELELDPDPRLQTLCFLELPPLASGASHFLCGADKEWVPTSKTYVRTRFSRGRHLPFYTSAIGTIALRFHYQQKGGLGYPYALIISVGALISAIPNDARNVPWEDWGPSSTHLFQSRVPLISLGPFWITDHPPSVVRQYDLPPTRWSQLMAVDISSLQSRPSIVDSAKIFQYDIKTHRPYRDVVIEKQDLNESVFILADREWVVGVRNLVRGFFLTIS